MPNVTPPPPQLPGEPKEWYDRFRAWLAQDKPRSKLEQANSERAAKGKKRQDSPPGSWDGKPEIYKWDERAKAYDDAEALRLAKERAKQRKDFVDAELRVATRMMEEGEKGINTITLLRGKVIKAKNGDVYELKGDPQAMKAAVYLVEAGSKIGRLALEIQPPAAPQPVTALSTLIAIMPPEYNEMIAKGKPIDVVVVEWIAAMRAEASKPIKD